MILDLRSYRLSARLTQEDLSQRLGISQAQISRYEDDPESIPTGLLLRWLVALGVDAAAALMGAGEVPAAGVDVGDPLAPLRRDLDLVGAFLDAGQPIDGLPQDAPRPEDLRALLAVLRCKPVVALVGHYDSGKSTVANALLGRSSLPTRYQPATKVVTYIRHMDERPPWINEDVWLLHEGFDPTRWTEHEHTEGARVVAGTLDTLRQHGLHPSAKERERPPLDVTYALVFLDAPVLRACTLVDHPGFGHSEKDDKRGSMADAPLVADVVIYTSRCVGFLDATDLVQLGQVVRALPDLETLDPTLPALGNLIVLATHAAPHIAEADLRDQILGEGAARIFDTLGETTLKDRGARTGRPLGVDELRRRAYPFFMERAQRRQEFEAAMAQLLRDHLPRAWRARADRELLDFKSKAKNHYEALLSTYRGWRSNLTRTADELAQVEIAEDERRGRVRAERERIEARIDLYEREALQALDDAYDEILTEERLEALIRKKYGNNKKKAQDYAFAWLIEVIQHGVERKTEVLGLRLKEDINRLLTEYEVEAFHVDGEAEPVAVPFNAQGAFIGGLAGLATVGGLAIWASTLGNLGAYIIVAKAVGLLSTLGISIPGGAAAVTSLVAALGGPIALGVGLVISSLLAGWALLGDSWQRRLARKLMTAFRNHDIYGQFQKLIHGYWRNTRVSFRKAADNVERQWNDRLQEIRIVAARDQSGLEPLDAWLERFSAGRDLFGGLPWRRRDEG